MSSEDAVALLLKTAAVENMQDNSTRKAVEQVAKVLDYFALAIIQAGAVLRQRVCTLDEFCELYAKQKKELLESGRSQSSVDYQYSVYTTWEISIKKIEEMSNKHTVLALELIRLFSFIHFDGIRKDIFKQAVENPYLPGEWYDRGIFKRSILVQMMPSGWDGVTVGRALALLVAFSLITIGDNGNISMHPLVHEWSRDRMSDAQRRQAWETALVTIGLSVGDGMSMGDGIQDVHGQQQRKVMLPHIDACLAHYSDELFAGDGPELAERSYAARKFVTAYNENYRFDRALDLALKDLKSKETLLSPDHRYCFEVKVNVSRNLYQLGRFQEGSVVLEGLLEVALRDKTDTGTIMAMVGLAACYTGLGQHQRAIDMGEEAISKFESVLGGDDPMILAATEVIGGANLEMGRLDEALVFTKKVLERRRKIFGEGHLGTLTAMRALAKVYDELKLFKKARLIQEQWLALSKESLGPEHYLVIEALNSLANAARRQGNQFQSKKGIEYRRELLELLQARYGEMDPRTLYCMELLGEDYFFRGLFSQCQLVQENLARKIIQTRGANDVETVRVIGSLARTRKCISVRKALYRWVPKKLLAKNRGEAGNVEHSSGRQET